MDDLFSEPTATPLRRTRSPRERPSRLGQTLREARQDGRLGLEDLAELTDIRPVYLEALEAGRFSELPGDSHSKSFIRRYAQAVGLDPARVMVLYAQERRSLKAAGDPAAHTFRGLELPGAEGNTLSVHPQFGRLLRLFASLLLVAAAIWLALRVFDGALTPGQQPGQRTGQQQSQTQREDPSSAATWPGAAAAPTTATTPAVDGSAPTPAPALILFSLRTTPPRAEVSIDGYHFGQSPVVDAPVRAGNRIIKVERSGYTTFERTLEFTQDSRLNVTLFPEGTNEATSSVTPLTAAAPAKIQTPTQAQAPTAQAQVAISVTAEAWLEVYRGSARAGERLVYETAQPGDVYTFAAPVYVFSGNAGGISVARRGAPAQPLGAPGAVVGAAYGR